MTNLKIMAVDDEYLALTWLSDLIKETAPEAECRAFQDPEEALACLKDFNPDVAFLDIEMRTYNGMELACKLKEINPRINIIFTTGYKQYMEDAFQIHASGYIIKPVTREKIKRELDNLRFDVSIRQNRVRIQTFGVFEIFIDGIPADFSYAKTKELFAVLVDCKGAMCTNGKLISVIWEDEDNITSHDSYIRNLISDLQKNLRAHGCEDIILKKRGQIGIDRNKVDCDYFDWLQGKEVTFSGEYMSQYSWAEVTLAEIISKNDAKSGH